MFRDPEFVERFSGKDFRFLRAVVVDNEDPTQDYRVRVSCPEVYGQDLSPWVQPCLPLACGIGTGFFSIPSIGSTLFIFFDNGFVANPVYIGGFPHKLNVGRPSSGTPVEESPEYQGQTNSGPAHTKGMPDASDFDGSVRGFDGVPTTTFVGKYPHVHSWNSPKGHVVELDDTPDAERILLFHRKGSFIEIMPDGSIQFIALGNQIRYSLGDRRTVRGNDISNISGDHTDTVAGHYEVTAGKSYSLSATGGTFSFTRGLSYAIKGGHTKDISGEHSIEATGNATYSFGGGYSLSVSGNAGYSYGGAVNVNIANTMATSPLALTYSHLVHGGRGRVAATGRLLPLTRYGSEYMGEGINGSIVPTVGQIGPYFRCGNITVPVVSDGVPLLQEPMVLGIQLNLFLNQLMSFLQSWFTDYLAHTHSPFTPPISAPVLAAALAPIFVSAQTTWLTPTGAKATTLLQSDSAYVSK